MELYLDSADLNEIEEAFKLGFLTGLTTTPTFMHRGGVTDIDGLIVELSKIVPVLQIEALGDTAEDVLKEAKRQLALGLDPKKTETECQLAFRFFEHRSEEHTSELQSRRDLVCRLLLEKKKKTT